MEKGVSEVSTWITKIHSPKIGRKSMWEIVYYRKFTILSILAATLPHLNQKKKKSYNISIVINYCNKNIPQNLFKSQFLFFQLSISFIKYTRGITKYFLSFYFFYTSYIIYCISLCCPWLVSVVLLDMLGVIKFSR